MLFITGAYKQKLLDEKKWEYEDRSVYVIVYMLYICLYSMYYIHSAYCIHIVYSINSVYGICRIVCSVLRCINRNPVYCVLDIMIFTIYSNTGVSLYTTRTYSFHHIHIISYICKHTYTYIHFPLTD